VPIESVWCPLCKKSTWIDYKYEKETVDVLQIEKFIQQGCCKHCGRQIYQITVKAVEKECSKKNEG